MTSKILFFLPDIDLSNGVIQSQIVGRANYLSSNGVKCFIQSRDQYKIASSLLQNKNIIFILVPKTTYRLPFFSKYIYSIFIAIKNIKFYRFNNITHVYIRNPYLISAAYILKRVLKIQLIYDIRGVPSEEVKILEMPLYYSLIYKFFEKLAFKKADKLSTVSEKLKKYLIDQYYFKPITVIPTCISSKKENESISRFQFNEILSYDKNYKIICYVGGMSRWQKFDKILEYFEEIRKLNNNYRFLIITKDINYANQVITNLDVKRDYYKVITLEHRKIRLFIEHCHCGILIRDDILINNVASPIKIGEYLSSGLPIILNENIGDISNILEKNGLAFLITGEVKKDAANILNFLENIDKKHISKKCKSFASIYYSWNTYKSEFVKLYFG